MPLLRYIALALVAMGACATSQAHAWSASMAANVTTPNLINNGKANVTIGVGCASFVPYETQVPDPLVPSFSYVIENKLAQFIALHFSNFNLPAGDYVVIRPTNPTNAENETHRYRGDEMAGAFFASALHTKSITIELFRTGDTRPTNPFTCMGFAIDSYRFLAQGSNFVGSAQEEVCGADDTREASCFVSSAQAYANADAVVRLLIHKPEGSFFCTGWLVGCEGHVVTNHHCISEQIHASNTEFEFRAQGSKCEQSCDKPLACAGNTRARSSTLIYASQTLDYALVKLGINLSNEYGYLKLRESGAVMNERIYIPQHPSGWGKRIAMKDDNGYGKVESLNQGGCTTEQVAYSLDTRAGSSGSPVIAWSDHAVVALHHCGGCPNTAINANKLVRDWRARGILPNCAVYETPTNTKAPARVPPPVPAPTPAPVPPQAPSPSTQRVYVDGTLFSTSTTTSIDYTDFTVSQQADVEIDILSNEEVLTGSYTRYVDVNKDCNAGYIDSSIVLFRVNGDGKISLATAIAANNDAPYGYGMNDGSVSSTDSYIRVLLSPGRYRVAVGSAPMTLDQSVTGSMPLGSSPRICSAPLSNYGNYRLTVSSNANIAIASSPNSYIGSQCVAGYNSAPYPKCPYHTEQMLSKAVTIDGTIKRQGSTLTVDHIPFTVNQFGRVNIAVSSYETKDGFTFIDINGDCTSSYIDPVVYLFRRPANGAPLTASDLVNSGDDDNNFARRKNILSISFRDPFISLALPVGNYIAMVGRYPLSIPDAINKINTKSADKFTPESCGKKANQGNYMVTFSSSRQLDVTSPNSFVGSKCPNNIGRTICVAS